MTVGAILCYAWCMETMVYLVNDLRRAHPAPPFLYVHRREGKVLYVGSTVQGTQRVLNYKQPWRSRLKEDDTITLYMVPPELAEYLRELEEMLILELRPTENGWYPGESHRGTRGGVMCGPSPLRPREGYWASPWSRWR